MAGGRPLSCKKFYPHNPQRSLAKILKVCREDENVKRNMLDFASSLTKSFGSIRGKKYTVRKCSKLHYTEYL